ncbi:MAG TPA: hypothetical protein VM263_07810, partial [Acidimicrobiales bacterium]|nr:hypothetical protein [Acidimicrobiales bacterium]
LEDLVRFVQHPVRAFLRQRLGIFVGGDEDEAADDLPVEPDPLERWAVGQRMLEARLAGSDAATCRAAEAARGALPPGALAAPFLDAVAGEVEGIVAAVPVAAGEASASLEVVVELGGGRTLVGTVPGVFGDTLRSVFYSRLAAKHRLAAWVRLLAATAADPARAFCAVTIGRGGRGKVAVARLPPLAADAAGRRRAALGHLAVVLDLHARGLREPLPLYCKTSAAWAGARALGRDAHRAAAAEWSTDWELSREDVELEHQLVLGGVLALDRVLAAAPCDDEAGDGWAGDEGSRFGRYARRLWDPVLAVEGRR